MAWLYSHGEVLNRTDDEEQTEITVRLAPEDVQRFERQRNVRDGNVKSNGGGR
jgi:hypothetical protein